MVDGYPRTVTLSGGAILTLRPMTRDDEYDTARFFGSLPAETRRYLRNDVTDRKVIAKWMRELDYEKTLPIIAEKDGKVVASATLHRQTFGWGRHVAEVRVVIDPSVQGHGLGGILLEDLSRVATDIGLKKLVARIVTADGGAIRAFERAGFHRVAVLEKYVKLVGQGYADIAILVKELAREARPGREEAACAMS
jgi:RimJ/RimL family protein N-acetyltransferase